MKKRMFWSYLTVLLIAVGCSDMNDVHDMYLRNGEIIYIGRVDSAKVLAGKERFMLRYWVTDPKAKILKVYWSQKQDSVIFAIPPHNPTDSIDVVIGDDQKKIPEGNYIFQLVSTDGEGLRSIVHEKTGNVYGENFQATIFNRLVKQAEYKSDEARLIIDWGDVTSSKETGLEVTYYNLAGEEVKAFLPTGETGKQTILENVDFTDPEKKLSVRTVFLPEQQAIDTFYTEPVIIPVKRRIRLKEPVNIALNKAVTANAYYTTFVPQYAVDGIISNESRWINTAVASHWLEIDLGQESTIEGFKLLTGTGGNFMQPIVNFDFQVDVNGEWVTVKSATSNTNPQYKATFSEVTTGKVRLSITSSAVRLYEIEVYSFYTYVVL